MCFEYEAVECFSSCIRKSRKSHRCECCGSEIVRGSLYRFGSGIFDGDPFSVKHCGVCELKRWLIHVIELSHGCRWSESWCDDYDMNEVAENYDVPDYTPQEGQRFLAFEQVKTANLQTQQPRGIQ